MEQWLTIPEAAELYNRHIVTLYKLAAKLAKDGSPHTKTEGRERFISRDYIAEYTAPKRKVHKYIPSPAPPPEATQDELKEALFNRLDDLKQALEHERAIARQLSQQNAQLLEQNQRLLEQVDDLTALTIRLGMNRKTPPQISISDQEG